ncbi:MAG: helix-turn-helix domain-containing protein [Pseudomonadota bacterium]
MDQAAKIATVFDAASDVFSRYGFRRTAMNDIAEAAGISRPALYLMFENKEDLFRRLVTHRQTEATDAARRVLSESAPFPERFIQAILAFEELFYESVSQSPHGDELMDVGQSIASDDMMAGIRELFGVLALSIETAISKGDADLSGTDLQPLDFVELLMSSIGGLKKSATSIDDFRQKVRNVTSIFLTSIIIRDPG